MSSLLRFTGDNSGRGVSGDLWSLTADWVNGSPAIDQGSLGVEDFAPFRDGAGWTVSGSTGADLVEVAERHGVANLQATAGTNADAGVVIDRYYDLSEGRPAVVEARIEQNADANSPQVIVGFSDQAGSAVFASGAVASASNQDTLGLLWNADETVDLVSVVDGTLSVLKAEIATVERTSGYVKLGIRVVKETSTQYTVFCSVNGTVRKALNLTTSQIPQNPMKPIVGATNAASTAISVDIDWIVDYDKV